MNANLANDIGNLLNRTLNLLHKFCSGAVPHDSAGESQRYQRHRSREVLVKTGTHGHGWGHLLL